MKKLLAFICYLSLAACNLPATPKVMPPTPAGRPASEPAPVPARETAAPTPAEAGSIATPVKAPEGPALPPAPVLQPASLFSAAPATEWQPAGVYAGPDISLPFDPSQAANPGVLSGLTTEQAALLARNGFVVIQTQEAQFGEIRKIGRYYGQPYYLTTDAAFHALHLTFDELLKAIEKQNLRPRMGTLLRQVLEQVVAALDQAQGTPLEEDVRLAAAYLSVAVKLFDPSAAVDPRLADLVAKQLAQIEAGGGQQKSVLIPGFEDDYSAYKPAGHYAGDPALESYFRGMTWFGRAHFRLEDPADPGFRPSRAPLIITLALRRAASGSAITEWAHLHALLTFLVGPSDDAGPAEYSVLMDQVYGNQATLLSLADESAWKTFLERSAEIPAPQIHSTFAASSQDMEAERGWRFLGQRFTLDAGILQNLVFDHVGTREKPRKLPSGLDVMAAFGSQPAYTALEQSGETGYANYSEQLAALQSLVREQSESQWLETVFGSWLYAFLPQVAAKDEAFPELMRTTAWGDKELNSALGSWAELKHDTVLYTKMPEGFGGGGPPSSGPPPGYVEPNPAVFYRMAALARRLSAGLQPFVGMVEIEPPAPEDFTYSMGGLIGYLDRVQSLAGDLQALGEIAAGELAGQPFSQDDYERIQSCLGPVECQVEYMEKMNILSGGQGPLMEMPPVPVVAAVAGAEDKILQVGVGQVDRIYVIVPLEGRLEIAQGGVFSYYEFAQPRAERLTDEEWRARLAANPPQRPAWAASFSLPGGRPTDLLFFRVGDVYKITQAGDRLNVRKSPGTGAAVLRQLFAGDYITVVDGPVQAGGKSWWKIRIEDTSDSPPEGWVVEDQAWYERAWGQ